MTNRTRLWRLLAVVLAFTLIGAACGDDDDDAGGDDDDAADDAGGDDTGGDDTGGDDDSGDLTSVKLQLQWVPQAQFAYSMAVVYWVPSWPTRKWRRGWLTL